MMTKQAKLGLSKTLLVELILSFQCRVMISNEEIVTKLLFGVYKISFETKIIYIFRRCVSLYALHNLKDFNTGGMRWTLKFNECFSRR